MIVDANDPGGPETFQSPILIIGGGAAGLALAMRLEARGRDCLVIEAGGEGLDKAQQEFYRAASIAPETHGPVHLYRRRALGGTTAIWGGRCIPFDPIDFENRDWIPHARWPIRYGEVARYYPDAAEICKAGPAVFDAHQALPHAQSPMIGGFDDQDVILDRVERFSEPTHFGRSYRAALAASARTTVVINAGAVEILTDASGSAVTGVRARTTSGRVVEIAGSIVVVAAGALETARLLLASNATKACGLGNTRDLVGRFYQSHLEGEVGTLQFTDAPRDVRLDYERSPEGVYCRRYIWLSPKAQREHRLGGLILRPHHAKIADAAHGDPVLSAMFLVKDMLVPEYGRRMNSVETAAAGAVQTSRLTAYRRHLTNVIVGSPRLAGFAVDWVRRRNLARRKLPSVVLRDRRNRYVLDVNAEQTPNPASRVTLAAETDAFGTPRLAIDWRETDQDRDMVARGLRVIQAALARHEGAELILDEARLEDEIAALTRVGGHHIGTARMGSSAQDGVVDGDGQAFDTRGLYVTGAATFPTSGFANPTFVLVALALRLGDHLAQGV